MELFTACKINDSSEKGADLKQATVIIPNYNGAHFLKPCLEALRAQDTDDFEILIIDNGSEDGSVDYLCSQDDVKTIFLPKNEGFCAAINIGVRAAETPYSILLNNDTIPEKGFISALINGIEKRKDAFACTSCMLDVKDPTILDGAGDLYNLFGWGFAKGKGEKASKYNKTCKVFSACAGAAIYRTELFKKLGMLDERHFAYLEDMDLSFRARLAGYEIYYIPEARVVHVGSGTTGGKHSEFKVRISARNNLYMIYKNMSAGMFILNFLPLAAGHAIKYAYFSGKGLGKAYIEGIKEGIKYCRDPKTAARKKAASEAGFSRLAKIQLWLILNMFAKRKA